MKPRNIAAALILGAASVSAQTPWLHLYYPKTTGYESHNMTDVLDLSFDEESGQINVNLDGGAKTYSMGEIEKFNIGPTVGRIDIQTELDYYPEEFGYKYEGLPITDVVSKEVYLDAHLTFDGAGLWPDVDTTVKIRGRGNSSWSQPKKPYRLKFPEKTKFGGLHKGKNLVLLASYHDKSMLDNFVAFTVGQLVGMPYINRALPVEVYFNGIYKGAYMLTEKVGINNASVDLTKEDEANSILFELDTYTMADDEEGFHVPIPVTEEARYPWESPYEIYKYMPVIFKDPDGPVDYDEREIWKTEWQEDFEDMVDIVLNGTAKRKFETIDIESLARYILVFDIACNQELNHPKSVYLHKTKGGKWEFGPCWDFDWAYGYQPTYKTGGPSYENPLIGEGNSGNQGGGTFFKNLLDNTTFKNKFKEVWRDFYDNKQADFWAALDEYIDDIEPSAYHQNSTLPQYSFGDFRSHAQELRDWVKERIEFINSDPNYGLWED